MLIMGIDPGVATVGFGFVEMNGRDFRAIEYGVVETKPRQLLEERLKQIYDDICTLLKNYRPECISIEELFFNSNTTTAIDVAQARGVILLAARQHGTDVYEYTPLQVKSSLTGYGRADKHQMQYMTRLLLHLGETPRPDDAADALALAICHGQHAASVITGR